jgi:hypothetical protein
MSKEATKAALATATPKPKADETLISIAESVLAYRGEERPNLATVARIINRASALLRISDQDERMSYENVATLALAKKLNLVS